MTRPANLGLYRRTLRRAVLPPVLAMAALAALLLWQIWALLSAVKAVEHTDAVITQATLAEKLMIDAETGQRGYLVGKSDVFWQPYTLALRQLPDVFRDLEAQVQNDAAQLARIKSLETGFADWREEAQKTVALRQSDAPDFAAYFNEARGKNKMDALRTEFKTFLDAELFRRSARSQNVQDTTTSAILAGVIATFAIGGLLVWSTRQNLGDLAHQYEAALDEEQSLRERLSATLHSIGDAVLVTDEKGNVQAMNPVCERLTGWTQAEARGESAKIVFDIVNETTRAVVESPIERAIREGTIVGLANHTILMQKNGGEIPIDDSAAPIHDKKGNLNGIVLVFRDISERKEAEAVLATAAAKNERIAATLQSSMLLAPLPNAFPGMEVVAKYEAAGDEAEVGGDFYDAFALDAGRVAFVVGDVTGKGLEAAAHTAQVKFSLRAFLREDPDPAKALERVNKLLADGQRLEVGAKTAFVCVAVAVVDTETGAVECAAGGAEPPLVYRAETGRAEEVAVYGVVVGADAGTQYTSLPLFLSPGDVLAFTTDGITEARSVERTFFGYEGFVEAVEAAGKNSPETIAGTIIAQAKAFASGKMRDDVCLLVAKRQ